MLVSSNFPIVAISRPAHAKIVTQITIVIDCILLTILIAYNSSVMEIVLVYVPIF